MVAPQVVSWFMIPQTSWSYVHQPVALWEAPPSSSLPSGHLRLSLAHRLRPQRWRDWHGGNRRGDGGGADGGPGVRVDQGGGEQEGAKEKQMWKDCMIVCLLCAFGFLCFYVS